MKKKWLALVLAFVCVTGLAVPIAAAAATSAISKTSETSARAAAYQYWLFDPEDTSRYLNEIYCSLDSLTVQADDGEYYRLRDLSELTRTDVFTCTTKSEVNANLIKSIRIEQGEMQKPGTPSFAIRMTDNAVLDRQTLGFKATYTAKADTTLTVRESDEKIDRQLTIKKGTKLIFAIDLLVDYQKLIKLDVVPRYAASLDSIRRDPWPTGVSGDVITPEIGGDKDYTWESIGRLCATVDGSLSGTPKLSTLWDDGVLKAKFIKGQAYIRSFAACTVDGKATLTLTNPFITLDGEESTPHNKLIIYAYSAGKLTDVTKSFRYTTDCDENGAFTISTDQLGTYIISNVKAAA